MKLIINKMLKVVHKNLKPKTEVELLWEHLERKWKKKEKPIHKINSSLKKTS